jgi:uncharacterized DUF497 family protein
MYTLHIHREGIMIRRIEGFIWLEWVVEKLSVKHGIDLEEVEEAFFHPPYKVRRSGSGKMLLYGRSQGGRYLLIVFALEGRQVKVISARDVTEAERRLFRQK